MIPEAQDNSMNQRKQVVFEVEETVVLREGETSTKGFCPFCGEAVAMATTWIAANVHEISEREIFRMIERGAIYVTEGERILMCLRCVGRVSIGTSRPPIDIRPINRDLDGPTGSSAEKNI